MSDASPSTPAPPPEGPRATVARLRAWHKAHPVAEAAGFFAGGFLFDVATLSRIDDTLTMLQLGLYMVMLSALLVAAETWVTGGRTPPAWLARGLAYAEDAIHFLFGSLLSCFGLFYFKSASGLTSVLFTVGIFGLLVANELPQFRRRGPVVRFALFAFCTASYLAYALPTLAGMLSDWLFLAALALSGLVVYGLYRALAAVGLERARLQRVCLAPSTVMLVVLALAYVGRAIPPVPLNVQYMGIYHHVERQGAQFKLLHQRPSWRVWHHGDQKFQARPGDRVYVFVAVFAPDRFHERVNIRWLREGPNGWATSDVIPLNVTGGREAGFRGFAFKSNHEPGAWRVEVETEDGRTIGYIPFEIHADTESDERVFREELR